MVDNVREIVHGVAEVEKAVEEINRAVAVETIKATKAAQSVAKRQIKSGMRGAPRWGQRGAIGRNKDIPAVNIGRRPRHIARGGGVGKLTGHLQGAVGGMKRPKVKGGTKVVGGVGVGGRKSVTLIYRSRVSDKYPFMEPGVAKAAPKIRAAYERAWAKATEK